MWNVSDWKDYELLDTSDGERLERWGNVILIRPDPQIIWKDVKKHELWNHYHARYVRSQKGGGQWDIKSLPENLPVNLLNTGWTIGYRDLTFQVRPTGFKHTGVFPEQAVNWNFITEKIKTANRKISVLNLFAYTGGATLAAASAGANVCHVDASKGIVSWAKENIALSKLEQVPVRFLVDDCKKFLEREIRRGNKYDALIMDPPSYGRGPSGEIWKLEDDINDLILLASQVMSDDPLFFLVNSYTTGLSASTVGYLLQLHIKSKFNGNVSADEIGIPVTVTGGILPAGSSARWEQS